ncbi:hypothetical protein AFK24_12230 [Pseudomonas syringae]|uniref:Dermonecrotic toxin N-terminal domain-containing protein n=1 Tax=Pseudomonas syringae TaxID=317 RepID=A0A1C7Z4N3_PSESX|nr:DUF6543 domain-containing protein [Pseudomonas syringae]OCR24881.1 hypothetical protein AFK24_12230 [Pseudomonas syringae]
MSALPAPYFHPGPLRARFARDVSDAFLNERIDVQEHRWLERLFSPSLVVEGASVLDFPRLDQLITEDGVPTTAEMTGALLISHRSGNDQRVYLSTLLYGLERFDNRRQLQSRLGELFSALADSRPAYEYQRVDDMLFNPRMLAIIDQQADHLRSLTRHLRQIPCLRTSMRHALEQQLADAFAGTSISATSNTLVQVIKMGAHRTDGVSTPTVVNVQILLDVMTQVLTGHTLPAGQSRAFLDSSGQPVEAAHALLYEKAIADAARNLKDSYEALFGNYMRKSRVEGLTARERIAGALAETLRQHLLAQRQDGSLSIDEFRPLAALLHPSAKRSETDNTPRVQKLCVVGTDQSLLKLVSPLLVDFGAEGPPNLMLYSPLKGLRRFSTLGAISDHFSTDQGRAELRRYLSLDDLVLLSARGPLRLQAYPMEHAFADERVDAVLALQQRNLRFVLSKPLPDILEADAMIDDALDIRQLIDCRLLRAEAGGRWSDDDSAFVDKWPSIFPAHTVPNLPALVPVPATVETTVTETPVAATWLEQLGALENQVQLLADLDPDIETCVRQALNEYLAVLLAAPVDAAHVWVQWAGGPAAGAAIGSNVATSTLQRFKLTDLLLERLSGRRPAPLPDSSVALVELIQGQPDSLDQLCPAIINHVLERIETGFIDGYLQRLSDLDSRSVRRAGQQFDTRALADRIYWHLLRLSGDVEDRLDGLTQPQLTMLQQVLNYPERSLRDQFGDAQTQIYLMSLHHDPALPAVAMADAFLLRRPARPEEGVVFWSAIGGLRKGATAALVESRLNLGLARAETREKWLGLFAEKDRALIRGYLQRPLKSPLTLKLNPVDGHFLRALQQRRLDRLQSDVSQGWQNAKKSRMPASLLISFLDRIQADQRRLPTLDSLTITVQVILFQAQLPEWLKNATDSDMLALGNMLRRDARNSDPAKDFLAGIPALSAFAHESLRHRLKADFPEQNLDPDNISITVTQYVPALVPLGETPSSLAAATIVNRETLTEYALNHFSQIQSATLSVVLPAAIAPADRLTAGYFQTLVRDLDVGEQYQALLASTLDQNNEEYALRRQRFIAQAPSRMLVAALVMKLSGQLSDTAYDYLKSLLDMPDSVARQPVHGQDIILRPLLLIPAADMPADAAAGMFLIGPRDVTQGPIILHALFSDPYAFKEYADQSALLTDLRQSSALQELVLNRVGPQLRTRYDNGGFSEAHIPFDTEGLFAVPFEGRGPVELADMPQSGNVLRFLFEETLWSIKDISKKQSVTTAQADWRSFVHLMSLAADQLLSFVPGKIGFMVAAWQSQLLFKGSVEAVYERNWGKAASEFSAALGMLVSSRHSLEEVQTEDIIDSDPAPNAPAFPEFTWRNSRLTPELLARLQAFEARDIVLEELPKDPLYNLYRHPVTGKLYAAVAGQVYQVETDSNAWFIVGEQGNGPRIKLNERQQWELDIDWGLRGGGSMLTSLKVIRTDFVVDEAIVIEARGIKEIRRLYRNRVVMIDEARRHAIRYAEDCLLNLTPVQPEGDLRVEVRQMIMDFFGVQSPSPELLAAIHTIVTDLYLGISDASLSTFSSIRYVTGSNKPGVESTQAFIFRSDPLRRIYLTERFFETPPFRLKPQGGMHGSFNVGAHYRAASLLHEVSHLVNDTHDIAYVESSAPFVDLLADPLSPEDTFREDLEFLRTRTLSHLADPVHLFVRYDRSLWRDLNDWDGAGKQAVLRITGKETLEQARNVFLNDAQKRSEIILNNADSVTWLVMNLGRRRFS